MRVVLRLWLLLLLPSSTLVVAGSASAEDRSYRELIEEALEEFSRGNYVEARALFQLGHDMRPSARTFRGLGIVEYELREYVLAAGYLEAALADTRNRLTPNQRKQTQDVLARARRFIGRFEVELEPSSATLSVDGNRLPADHQGPLLLDPGKHRLVAEADGHEAKVVVLSVRGGEHKPLKLRLRPSARPEAVATPTAAAPAAAEPYDGEAEPVGDGPPVAAFVALAVGGAGLVTFGVAGGLALSKDSELQDCSPDCTQDEVDTEKTYMLIADIGLGVGLVGAAVGTVLWLSHEPEAERASARVEPWLDRGVTGVRAAGHF